MTDRNTPTPLPSPSSQRSPSRSPSLAASLPGAAAAVAAIWVIGRPLGQALPGLIHEAAANWKEPGPWIALGLDLMAMGLLVAPVPTLALARSLLGRILSNRNNERKD